MQYIAYMSENICIDSVDHLSHRARYNLLNVTTQFECFLNTLSTITEGYNFACIAGQNSSIHILCYISKVSGLQRMFWLLF